MQWQTLGLAAGLLLASLPGPAVGAEVKPLLARIKAVGTKGQGNVEAARAWRQLTACGPAALPDILSTLDEASPIAANWLRSAVEAIIDRAVTARQRLPADKLEAFVLDRRHAGPARRLAFDCLARIDQTAHDRLIPGMLDDPGAELRRDAVAGLLRQAAALREQNHLKAATAVYQKAFRAARDRDQVELVANQLKKLNVAVDLVAHYGFLTHWQLLGPFDNRRDVGFARVYPPEKKIDLNAPFAGKTKPSLRWVEHTTRLPNGLVDLNAALGKNMGATAYAFAVVVSPKDQPIQLRAASNNAVKIFLNGKEIYAREEYHHGMRMDQHTGSGRLRAGRNEILVKVCQNEQTDEWAQSWSFQLRVCDAIGGAVALQRESTPSNRAPKGAK